MTCIAGDKWEVTPHHAWSAVAWLGAAVVIGVAVVLQSQRFAWTGLFLTAAAATYNICASGRAAAMIQREAFELGQEHERRRAAEADLPRLG